MLAPPTPAGDGELLFSNTLGGGGDATDHEVPNAPVTQAYGHRYNPQCLEEAALC